MTNSSRGLERKQFDDIQKHVDMLERRTNYHEENNDDITTNSEFDNLLENKLDLRLCSARIQINLDFES